MVMVDAIERVEALRAQIGHNQQEIAQKEVQIKNANDGSNIQ